MSSKSCGGMCGYRILWLLAIVTLIDSNSSTRRTLHSSLNPGCKEVCNGKNVTMIYLRADGPADTLHYLWDFIDSPSVLLAVTPPTAELSIIWEDYILRHENCVTFTEEPTYTFGVMIKEIVEFNDLNDTAVIDTTNVSNLNILHLEHFYWERRTFSQGDEIVGLDMEGNFYNDTALNITRDGSVKLSLRGFRSLDHSGIVPHLLHTENSTQVDIILDQLQTNSTFSNSRFAIRLVLVSEGNPDAIVSVEPRKSLDDEHTPGIFEIVEVKTPPYKQANDIENIGAFLQWRPVSYTTPSRDTTSSTETAQYPPRKFTNHTAEIENSMLYCYYGKRANEIFAQGITVSLGSIGDGFYKKTNYSTWTFLVGYGSPPDERFSNLVIMIISIGIGLPLLIIFAAGIYTCIRKMPKTRSNVSLNR